MTNYQIAFIAATIFAMNMPLIFGMFKKEEPVEEIKFFVAFVFWLDISFIAYGILSLYMKLYKYLGAV